MLLCNLKIIGHEFTKHIYVENEKIKDIMDDDQLFSHPSSIPRIYFENAIAFSGLINSHDHLDFNLFPLLGNRIYESYIDWGADIQKQNKNIIENITQIPKQLRVQWGVYKNLLNGVTTVIHHGDYLKIENPVIDVFQNCHSLHSVGREKNWKLKLNNPFAKRQPFVIHVGEGTNRESFEEINQLIHWNLLKRELIGVHGVSMNRQQAKAFEALIWCPNSNYFLLNTTANINELKHETKILFGTDSTVSADWNLWEQLRLARKTKLLTDEELFISLTCLPASVWKLNDRDAISKAKYADIVVAKKENNVTLMDSFFELDPQDILLVMKNGRLVLIDETLISQLRLDTDQFSKIIINYAVKYVKGDLPRIAVQIKEYATEAKMPFTF